MDSLLQRPALTFLTEDGKEKIHQTALKILAEIGMQVMHEEALDLLIHAGCTVDQQGRVKIPSVIVDKALRSAPGSIRIYDRNGEPAMDLGAPVPTSSIRTIPAAQAGIGAFFRTCAGEPLCATPFRTSISSCPLPIPRMSLRERPT